MIRNLINAALILTVAVILIVFARYVRLGPTVNAVVVLKSSGLTCGDCAAKVSRALQNQQGVAATEVDLQGGYVVAGYDAQQVTPQLLAGAVTRVGFASTVQAVLSPEQFKSVTGHEVGRQNGCCGTRGCGSDRQNINKGENL